MAVGDTDTDPEGSRVLFAEIVRMHSNACPGIHHARRETLSPGQPHHSVPFCQKAAVFASKCSKNRCFMFRNNLSVPLYRISGQKPPGRTSIISPWHPFSSALIPFQ